MHGRHGRQLLASLRTRDATVSAHFRQDIAYDLLVVILRDVQQLGPRQDVVEVVLRSHHNWNHNRAHRFVMPSSIRMDCRASCIQYITIQQTPSKYQGSEKPANKQGPITVHAQLLGTY